MPYKKLDKLKDNIKKLDSIIVAYSGGVDSTFLLKVAYDVLKDNVIAVTARSVSFPEREYISAVAFVKELGVRHIEVISNELEIKAFYENHLDKCYHCKKEIFSKFREIANKYNIRYVTEGSNVDDLGDYRPGMKALEELNILSPLKKAGFTKEDIRTLSKEMNLPTWDKPSFACLASRFPYGTSITKEKLEMVDKAEEYLQNLGFKQVRVRHHGDIGRIEVPQKELNKFFDTDIMNQVNEKLKELGFKYAALDLKGYRTGSMNEVI